MPRSFRAAMCVLIAAVITPFGEAPSAAGAPGLQPSELEQEEMVREFEEAASEAGALGFYHDSETDELVVVVSAGSQNALDLNALPVAGIATRTEQVSLTEADIALTLEALVAIRSNLDMSADDSYFFYFDPETAKVVVRGSLPADEVLGRLGTLAPIVSYVESRAEFESRHSDFAPFHGGGEALDQFHPGYDFWCSTGFAVTKAGVYYMAVVRHCWQPIYFDIWSPGNGQIMGRETKFSNTHDDAGLISGSGYAARIWSGTNAGDNNSYSVKGATDPTVGVEYCRSGASTFLHCQQVVVALNGVGCGPTSCTDANQIVYRSNDGYLSSGGDSGAPFFLRSGSYAYIRGAHTGRNGSDMLAERWSRYTQLFGVSILTE